VGKITTITGKSRNREALCNAGLFLIVFLDKDRMNELDSDVAGIVEMSYNWLSHGVVGNSVCRTWESCPLAFPCAVNRVIHDGIASYAHFHDAFKKLLISTK
jgi:hypothetical protein